jgi:catechol 2,3-dioxygenase-like lactoylglutathione lyase family enzyme
LNAKRLDWMGVPTRHFAEIVACFRDVLGLEAEREDADFAVLRLPSGEAVEVFGPELAGAEQFATGPVVGFEVEDVREAREEMEAKGVEFLGPVHDGDPAAAWSHFRGPDGKVYEITQIPDGELRG